MRFPFSGPVYPYTPYSPAFFVNTQTSDTPNTFSKNGFEAVLENVSLLLVIVFARISKGKDFQSVCFMSEERTYHMASSRIHRRKYTCKSNMASSVVFDGTIGQGLCYLHMCSFTFNIPAYFVTVFVTRGKNHK